MFRSEKLTPLKALTAGLPTAVTPCPANLYSHLNSIHPPRFYHLDPPPFIYFILLR